MGFLLLHTCRLILSRRYRSLHGRRTQRVFAAVLVAVFALQQLAFAAPAPPTLTPPASQKISKSLWSVKIPPSVAVVDDFFEASLNTTLKPRQIILVQDAHSNESGQINLAKSLAHILEQTDVRYVFTEAGIGDDSLTFIKQYGDTATRQRVGLSYLRKGLIKGTEFLSFTSEKDFVLWGVEDRALYRESLEQYRSVAERRTSTLKYLARVEATIKLLKRRLLNPALQSFDEMRHSSEALSLTESYQRLFTEARKEALPTEPYPNLMRFSRLQAAEMRIDFKQAGLELAEAIKHIDASERELLVLDGMQSKLTAENFRHVHAFTKLLHERIDDLSAYPTLKSYLEYMGSASKLDPKEILKEEAELEQTLYTSLIASDSERRLLKAADHIRLLKQLLNLQLSPHAYEKISSSEESFFTTAAFLNRQITELQSDYDRLVLVQDGLDEVVETALRFYELTRRRDEMFVARMLEKMSLEGEATGVLVMGGFHTPNLKQILQQMNISYVVLSPQVFHQTNHERYERILLAQEFEAKQTAIAQMDAPVAQPERLLQLVGDLVQVSSDRAQAIEGARHTLETQADQRLRYETRQRALVKSQEAILSSGSRVEDPQVNGGYDALDMDRRSVEVLYLLLDIEQYLSQREGDSKTFTKQELINEGVLSEARVQARAFENLIRNAAITQSREEGPHVPRVIIATGQKRIQNYRRTVSAHYQDILMILGRVAELGSDVFTSAVLKDLELTSGGVDDHIRRAKTHGLIEIAGKDPITQRQQWRMTERGRHLLVSAPGSRLAMIEALKFALQDLQEIDINISPGIVGSADAVISELLFESIIPPIATLRKALEDTLGDMREIPFTKNPRDVFQLVQARNKLRNEVVEMYIRLLSDALSMVPNSKYAGTDMEAKVQGAMWHLENVRLHLMFSRTIISALTLGYAVNASVGRPSLKSDAPETSVQLGLAYILRDLDGPGMLPNFLKLRLTQLRDEQALINQRIGENPEAQEMVEYMTEALGMLEEIAGRFSAVGSRAKDRRSHTSKIILPRQRAALPPDVTAKLEQAMPVLRDIMLGAAQIVNKWRAKPDIQSRLKDPDAPLTEAIVTQADGEVQTYMLDQLLREIKEHLGMPFRVVAEESEGELGERIRLINNANLNAVFEIVIDPIDGTLRFVNPESPAFGTLMSIKYVNPRGEKDVIAGFWISPEYEYFSGTKGALFEASELEDGLYIWDIQNGVSQNKRRVPAFDTDRTDFAGGVIMAHRGGEQNLQTRGFIIDDTDQTCGLCAALVAMGRDIDPVANLDTNIKVWDAEVAMYFAEKQGGVAVDARGRHVLPFRGNRLYTDEKGDVRSRGKILIGHPYVIETLLRYHPPINEAGTSRALTANEEEIGSRATDRQKVYREHEDARAERERNARHRRWQLRAPWIFESVGQRLREKIGGFEDENYIGIMVIEVPGSEVEYKYVPIRSDKENELEGSNARIQEDLPGSLHLLRELVLENFDADDFELTDTLQETPSAEARLKNSQRLKTFIGKVLLRGKDAKRRAKDFDIIARTEASEERLLALFDQLIQEVLGPPEEAEPTVASDQPTEATTTRPELTEAELALDEALPAGVGTQIRDILEVIEIARRRVQAGDLREARMLLKQTLSDHNEILEGYMDNFDVIMALSPVMTLYHEVEVLLIAAETASKRFSTGKPSGARSLLEKISSSHVLAKYQIDMQLLARLPFRGDAQFMRAGLSDWHLQGREDFDTNQDAADWMWQKALNQAESHAPEDVDDLNFWRQQIFGDLWGNPITDPKTGAMGILMGREGAHKSTFSAHLAEAAFQIHRDDAVFVHLHEDGTLLGIGDFVANEVQPYQSKLFLSTPMATLQPIQFIVRLSASHEGAGRAVGSLSTDDAEDGMPDFEEFVRDQALRFLGPQHQDAYAHAVASLPRVFYDFHRPGTDFAGVSARLRTWLDAAFGDAGARSQDKAIQPTDATVSRLLWEVAPRDNLDEENPTTYFPPNTYAAIDPGYLKRHLRVRRHEFDFDVVVSQNPRNATLTIKLRPGDLEGGNNPLQFNLSMEGDESEGVHISRSQKAGEILINGVSYQVELEQFLTGHAAAKYWENVPLQPGFIQLSSAPGNLIRFELRTTEREGMYVAPAGARVPDPTKQDYETAAWNIIESLDIAFVEFNLDERGMFTLSFRMTDRHITDVVGFTYATLDRNAERVAGLERALADAMKIKNPRTQSGKQLGRWQKVRALKSVGLKKISIEAGSINKQPRASQLAKGSQQTDIDLEEKVWTLLANLLVDEELSDVTGDVRLSRRDTKRLVEDKLSMRAMDANEGELRIKLNRVLKAALAMRKLRTSNETQAERWKIISALKRRGITSIRIQLHERRGTTYGSRGTPIALPSLPAARERFAERLIESLNVPEETLGARSKKYNKVITQETYDQAAWNIIRGFMLIDVKKYLFGDTLKLTYHTAGKLTGGLKDLSHYSLRQNPERARQLESAIERTFSMLDPGTKKGKSFELFRKVNALKRRGVQRITISAKDNPATGARIKIATLLDQTVTALANIHGLYESKSSYARTFRKSAAAFEAAVRIYTESFQAFTDKTFSIETRRSIHGLDLTDDVLPAIHALSTHLVNIRDQTTSVRLDYREPLNEDQLEIFEAELKIALKKLALARARMEELIAEFNDESGSRIPPSFDFTGTTHSGTYTMASQKRDTRLSEDRWLHARIESDVPSGKGDLLMIFDGNGDSGTGAVMAEQIKQEFAPLFRKYLIGAHGDAHAAWLQTTRFLEQALRFSIAHITDEKALIIARSAGVKFTGIYIPDADDAGTTQAFVANLGDSVTLARDKDGGIHMTDVRFLKGLGFLSLDEIYERVPEIIPVTLSKDSVVLILSDGVYEQNPREEYIRTLLDVVSEPQVSAAHLLDANPGNDTATALIWKGSVVSADAGARSSGIDLSVVAENWDHVLGVLATWLYPYENKRQYPHIEISLMGVPIQFIPGESQSINELYRVFSHALTPSAISYGLNLNGRFSISRQIGDDENIEIIIREENTPHRIIKLGQGARHALVIGILQALQPRLAQAAEPVQVPMEFSDMSQATLLNFSQGQRGSEPVYEVRTAKGHPQVFEPLTLTQAELRSAKLKTRTQASRRKDSHRSEELPVQSLVQRYQVTLDDVIRNLNASLLKAQNHLISVGVDLREFQGTQQMQGLMLGIVRGARVAKAKAIQVRFVVHGLDDLSDDARKLAEESMQAVNRKGKVIFLPDQVAPAGWVQTQITAQFPAKDGRIYMPVDIAASRLSRVAHAIVMLLGVVGDIGERGAHTPQGWLINYNEVQPSDFSQPLVSRFRAYAQVEQTSAQEIKDAVSAGSRQFFYKLLIKATDAIDFTFQMWQKAFDALMSAA